MKFRKKYTIKSHHIHNMPDYRVNLGEGSVAIVGGGLVGCLLAVYLRKHGFAVSIFESRADPRGSQEVGRSINLVITSRGLHALTSVSPELAEQVMSVTTRVDGRTLHHASGEKAYQAYGPSSSYCNFSVSRWELNKVLMNAAESAGCQMFFSHPLAHLDIPNSTMYFYLYDKAESQLYQKTVVCSHVFGADGGGSKCRQALKGLLFEDETASDVCQPLGYGYKELVMPATATGGYVVDKDSLHIWPRGSHFLMGLANLDGSFTMTLYMHEKGEVSFDQLKTREQVEAFFAEHYPTAAELMPSYCDDFMNNPVGFLGTVLVSPWSFEKRFTLIGDAAHAITPFFGQGCNCGFEDVFVLHEIITSHLRSLQRIMGNDTVTCSSLDMANVLKEYANSRKPNSDAIANMALENFKEMMSKTADKRFLLEKDIELILAERHPGVYVSRYALITHSLLPYRECQGVGEIQEAILNELSENITDAKEADLNKADELINTKLIPYLSEHAITPDKCHYTSHYYEKQDATASS